MLWKEQRLTESPVKRPDELEEMISMAEKLGEGIPFVRVDLYLADGENLFRRDDIYTGYRCVISF